MKEHGKETPHKRDILKNGTAVRLTVGFVQGQGTHSKSTDWVRAEGGKDKTPLCFFQAKKETALSKTLGKMSPGLKCAIGNVISNLRQFTDKVFPVESLMSCVANCLETALLAFGAVSAPVIMNLLIFSSNRVPCWGDTWTTSMARKKAAIALPLIPSALNLMGKSGAKTSS